MASLSNREPAPTGDKDARERHVLLRCTDKRCRSEIGDMDPLYCVFASALVIFLGAASAVHHEPSLWQLA